MTYLFLWATGFLIFFVFLARSSSGHEPILCTLLSALWPILVMCVLSKVVFTRLYRIARWGMKS